MERRLTAILSADVVGYSRLMEVDEAGTLAALKAHRKELIHPAIDEHHERREGPAVAVEFAARAHPWRRRAMPLRRRCLE